MKRMNAKRSDRKYEGWGREIIEGTKRRGDTEKRKREVFQVTGET